MISASDSIAEIDSLWREASAAQFELQKDEFAEALLKIGTKYNYGQPPGIQSSPAQVAAFWRGLQLKDLALAQACALGRDVAWQQFLERFRQPLMQAAITITGSLSIGQELAGSFYSEVPLAAYAGRGSLMGFLRTSLAHKFVDQYRRTHRETPIDDKDFAAPAPSPSPAPEILERLSDSITRTIAALSPEERFLLSSWYLDQRTQLELAGLLRVHEATISRMLKRLTNKLHNELLKQLQKSGMSKRAAEESLGTDPRDLDINIRSLLQSSHPRTFLNREESPDAT